MWRIYTFIILICFTSCDFLSDKKPSTTFQSLESTQSGINFSNDILESEVLNYDTFPYLYMGGGVSIGDINNDGLADIYFTGNMTSNKLYLNKGNMQFEDITLKANVGGDNRWYTGTTMADVNNDGWLDIYVCVSGKFGVTTNQLFINNKDNTFTEKAKEFGLDDNSTSIQATFFDYNNDGFLDVYVANYPQINVSQGNEFYYMKMQDNRIEDSGHLFKNNKNNTFSDVTKEAKLHNFGLSLGVVATDFNQDGWQDLYVSNDFNVPDYFYLNQGDGTFKEVVKEATNNTSMFGMGIDAADFNNDGLVDLIELDMTPDDYKRSKTNMASMSPQTFFQAVEFGWHYQYMQNSLQLNNGINNNIPQFSNIARFAGMATTDWSWGALFADFDNDGWKDVIITNGMKRDVNNNDVNNKDSSAFFGEISKDNYLKYPSNPLDNYVFKNNKDLTFSKANEDWNISYKGFSNGLSYSDLDNDGDLDIVINNLNAKASVFENKSNENKSNYLTINLKGSPDNIFGLGTEVIINSKQGKQKQVLTLTRGFQSSVDTKLHFGLGTDTTINSIEVKWPNGNIQVLKNVKANQRLNITYNKQLKARNVTVSKSGFQEITNDVGVNYYHKENKYYDFNFEPLIPHKYSQFGSGISVGDVNNDGLDDFYVGNATGSSGAMYIQNSNGKFDIMSGPWQQDAHYEDMDVLLFDADNDKDLDLYVVSGGNDVDKKNQFFQDRIYINTPQGFVKGVGVLPTITSSGLPVICADYNNDGKKDLFVGGRLIPGSYPLPAKSYLLKNNGGKDLDLRFQDVTKQVVPELEKAGLVTSAIWDDYDSDGKIDLIIAGEWMPIRYFKNTGTKFIEETKKIGFEEKTGWWFALSKIDVDQDGDLDYLAGNLGLNYKYKASDKTPFEVYANDFDSNGKLDIVLSKVNKGVKVPLRGRECSSQQVPAIKQRFKTYNEFADADLEEIYGEKMLKEALHYSAKTFANYWIENKGKGVFEMHKLPNQAQLSSINKFEFFDYNGDKYPDVLVAGNLYGSEVETPRNDASFGLVLLGDPIKGFLPVASNESNLFIKGDVRGLSKIKIKNKKGTSFLVVVNNDQLKLIHFQK